MTQNTKTWLHGLFAALIGGGAGAVSSGIAIQFVSPQSALHTLELMGAAFVTSGLLAAFGYLKQSPLPTETLQVTEQTIKTSTVTVTPTETKP